MKASANLLELIGNTPLVKLNNLSSETSCNIYAKLEFYNPGGSVKDRVAQYIIKDAECKGLLKPGDTIVEATSGNMGIAFALLSAVKKYKCIFTLPESITKEKIQALKLFGAEVVLTPKGLPPHDERSCYKVAHRIAREKGAFYVNQYFNELNPEAHYKSTAPEIWEDTDGNIDTFICGIGTGGTITGVGKYLKERNPDIQVIGVEPVGSVFKDYLEKGVLTEGAEFDIEGIGKNFIPGVLNFDYIDDVIQTKDEEALRMVDILVRCEGILAGGSSGAAVAAAIKYASAANKNENIVVILPDTGLKYLSKFSV
ncbi:MAG: cysteine synthase family protein [Candidatus Dadabacteria bacterium]|nr:cysteine synthase family protein [Candidatus Dadabacteria bacterium]